MEVVGQLKGGRGDCYPNNQAILTHPNPVTCIWLNGTVTGNTNHVMKYSSICVDGIIVQLNIRDLSTFDYFPFDVYLDASVDTLHFNEIRFVMLFAIHNLLQLRSYILHTNRA